MGANDPQGWAIFDHRGMVGRIYKENHYTLLHIGFEEDFLLCFSQYAPGAGPVWTPGAWLAGFIKKTTIHLLHTKYESSGPCGFEDFLMFFPL